MRTYAESELVRGRFDQRTLLVFVGVCLMAIPLALLNSPEFTGDPQIYRNRMVLLFDGSIPYLNFQYEHLPLVLVPMVLAWVLGGGLGPGIYTVVFAMLMAICLAATAILLDRISEDGPTQRAGFRWVLLAAPLVPIVLFRSDPFPVALAVGGLLAMVTGREVAAISLEFSGVLAKGWPVVLATAEWSRGHRIRSVGLVVAAIALFGSSLALPGFSEVRSFSGIHSETAMGALLVAIRSAGGADLGITSQAGASYVLVPVWASVANLTLGVLVALLALARMQPGFSIDRAARVMAALTLALLLGSPLLSPQFILWATPFLALHRSRRVLRLAIVVTVLTLIYMTGWNPEFEGAQWWVWVLNLRNLALIALGVLCAWTVGADHSCDTQEGEGVEILV